MKLMLVAALLAGSFALSGCGGGKVDTGNVAEGNAAAAKPKPKVFPKLMLGDFDLNQLVRAFGTEPYWTLDMGPGTLTYTDFSVDKPEARPFYWADPVIAGDTATYTTRNVAGDAVVLVLTRKDCLEAGEDEATTPLTAILKIGSKTLRGCAGPKPAGEPDGKMDNRVE